MLPQAEAAENSEVDALRWKADFMRDKFARLVELIQRTLDEPSRGRLGEALGREHVFGGNGETGGGIGGGVDTPRR